MNQLIPINNENREFPVNCRDLHIFLGAGKDFTTWIKSRIEKYSFSEGLDFSPVLGKSTGGRPSTEYYITIDMAKELCMVENNDKGRKARRYFIEVEKKARELHQKPALPDNVALARMVLEEAEKAKQLEAKIVNYDKQISKLVPKAEVHDAFIKVDGYISLQKMAKSFEFKGAGPGKIFGILRELKILYYEGKENVPYQKYIDQGWFHVVQGFRYNGEEKIPYCRTMVTPKGESKLYHIIKIYVNGSDNNLFSSEDAA